MAMASWRSCARPEFRKQPSGAGRSISSRPASGVVDGQHERLLRRIEIEADDVLDLFGEIGVVGDLEALHLMRLEPVLGPDPLYARVADAHLLGHSPHAPVRGGGR